MGCASSATAADCDRLPEVCEDKAKAQSTSCDCASGEFEAKYSKGQKLGSGGFAKVYAVRRRADNEPLAVKIMSPSSGKINAVAVLTNTTKLRENFDREVAAWSAVGNSDHVVRLVDVMAEPRAFYTVTERCESTIMAKISAMPELWALESQRMLKEMLHGVQACHLAGIVHRDIKPDNFLVGTDGRTVKLCDFGLAAKIPSCGQLRGRCGTLPFMSPEMLTKGDAVHGKPTDVWSYGCTAYLLCFGKLPFVPETLTIDSMRKAVLAGAPPRRLQRGCEAAAFLQRLLERSPADRCTARESLAHGYLRDGAAAGAPARKEGPRGRRAGACDIDAVGPPLATVSETTSTGSSTPSVSQEDSAASAAAAVGPSSSGP